MPREVALYTRHECGLCEEAAEMLRSLAPSLDIAITERDIDADPALVQRFNDVIPVIAIGDRVVAQAPVDVDVLRKALIAALAEST